MCFTIVIATCNRPESLKVALRCVVKSVVKLGDNSRVVVVDNGDKQPAKSVVESFSGIDSTRLVYMTTASKNKPKALNAGIAQAVTKWIAFTDDDTLPEKEWLSNAETYISEHPEVSVFGGRIIPGEIDTSAPSWLKNADAVRLLRGPAVVSYEPMAKNGILDEKMPVPLGANVFVKKSIFKKYGGYDEALWRECGKAALGCEDAEFAIRVRAAGEKIGYAADVKVMHPVIVARSTVLHHLKWAWNAGVREGILFSPEKRALGNVRLLCAGICSAIKSICCLFVGKGTMAVKFIMSSSVALGEWKQRALMWQRCNLWGSRLFLSLCKWASIRTVTHRLLSNFVTWYYKNVSERHLAPFYGKDYLEGYSDHLEEEKIIKHYQANAICEALPEARKILVAGCSNGLLVKELRSKGRDACGVDVYPGMFEYADDGIKGFLRLGSMTKMPFADKDGFDALVAVDVLEHVPAGMVGKAVSEMHHLGVKYLALVINHTALECLGHVTMKPLGWWEKQLGGYFAVDPGLGFSKENIPSLYSLNNEEPRFTFWRRKDNEG